MGRPSSAAGSSFACGGNIVLQGESSTSLASRIASRVAAKPDGIVRSYREGGFTQARSFAALWRQAGDVAAALAAAGAVPSSPVVILADDILDFLPAVWACVRGGFVPAALMSAARGAVFHGDNGFQQLVSSLADPVIAADDHFATLLTRLPGLDTRRVVKLAAVTPALPGADFQGSLDVAWLVATSGSTGRMKLVALSTAALLFRNFATVQVAAVRQPTALSTFPLDGVTGQHAAFLHYDSWTQVSAEVAAARPAAVLDAVEACGIAVVTLTSSMIRAILAAEAGSTRKRQLGTLRIVGLGAEPIVAGLVQDFAALIACHGADPGVLAAGYGTTETGSLVAGSRALLTSGPSEPVCVGAPWDGVSMRVVGEDGAMLAEGEIGQLEISCPAKMFTAYLGESELTAAAFTADGWWKSGDLGQLTGGELTLHGRAKDILIQNGRKLSLAAIDAEIQRVLGVGGVGYSYRVAGTLAQGEALGVAFDAGGAVADGAAAIRTALVRRFGIQPHAVTSVQAARIPRTSGGKVRRDALAAMVERAAAPDRCLAPDTRGLRDRLGTIWSDVLSLDCPARLDDHFFEHGGDSLRAVALDLQIAEAFDIRVPSEAFFADPAFGSLLRLVGERLASMAGVPPQPGSDAGWPLPAAMRQGLASALAQWTGERLPGCPTVLGHNLAGDRPPIFWIFNVPHEPERLARALGPGQPLYAMRSGYQLIDYREDEIQTVALRYVSDIVRLCPAGPLFVGGNCQGGIIALAVAQHLLRRKRHVPLLMLMDWSFDLQAYRGRVLLISGIDNNHHNPRRLFAAPEMAWARGFAEFEFAEITGGYADGFDPPHVEVLARALGARMQAALGAAPPLLPDNGYRVRISVPPIPGQLGCGERRTLDVSVENSSGVAWAATAISGIVLSSRWFYAGHGEPGQPQPTADIPDLAPGQSATLRLPIVAPGIGGDYTLVLDLLEEGNRWFTPAASEWAVARVAVFDRVMLARRMSRPVHLS